MSEQKSHISFRLEGHIGVVTLERPESLNAISGALADDLTFCLRRAAINEDVWVVVLAAAGEKAFCVGADLKERSNFSLVQWYENREAMRAMFTAVRTLPQPSIASVFGFALGGGFELALSCDIIIAAEDARMGLPEVKVGLLPAGGGTQLLTRKVGGARAKNLIFRGKQVDAQAGKEMGLVAEIAPRDQLDEVTMSVAREVCASSPIAVRESKRAIEAAFGLPLEDGIAFEHEAWRRVIETEDRSEGIAAFNEKRDPRWKNT
ncbi:MAG TPA: enoyl-CoA hydratase-related protein [Actinomycetota bacterium]|nr:enoyl-CoA hydratase-related protein [Actinomycetota bacterium]